MNNKTKIALTTSIGLIIIAVTLVQFFIGFSNDNVVPSSEQLTIKWLALTFMLLSEIALTASLVLLMMPVKELNETLLKAGILPILFGYFALTVLLAVFRSFFTDHVSAYISTQITILGIVAVIIIAVIISSSTKDFQN